MKRYGTLVFMVIAIFITQRFNAGALGFEGVETSTTGTTSVAKPSVGGWFMNRLKAYVKETELKINETLLDNKEKAFTVRKELDYLYDQLGDPAKRAENVRVLSSSFVDIKQQLEKDLLALQLDNQKLQLLQEEMNAATTELRKSQVQQQVELLKNQILTITIPTLATKFSDYYVDLDDSVRKNPVIQQFSKSIIDTINDIGVQLQGKYWQPYALLNDQEVARAQQIALLDRLFNKNFDAFLKALKDFSGDDLSEGLITKNFIQALKSSSHKTIENNLMLLKKVNLSELSHDALLNVLTLQAIAYTLLAQGFNTVLYDPQNIKKTLQNLSEYGQGDALRDFKIILRKTIKNAVINADTLEGILQQDLKEWVEKARSDSKKMIISPYLDMLNANEGANTNEQKLLQLVREFDTEQNELVRSIDNRDRFKKSQEKLDELARRFIEEINASDPSQLALILMSKMQHAYNQLITTISRRGKETKYGAKITPEQGKELVQALLNALQRSTQLGVLRSIIRDYLTVVVDGQVIVLPQIKKEYANGLIENEKVPSDAVQAKRLALIRRNSVQLMKKTKKAYGVDDQSYPYFVWLIKGLEN